MLYKLFNIFIFCLTFTPIPLLFVTIFMAVDCMNSMIWKFFWISFVSNGCFLLWQSWTNMTSLLMKDNGMVIYKYFLLEISSENTNPRICLWSYLGHCCWEHTLTEITSREKGFIWLSIPGQSLSLWGKSRTQKPQEARHSQILE